MGLQINHAACVSVVIGWAFSELIVMAVLGCSGRPRRTISSEPSTMVFVILDGCLSTMDSKEK
jgi:hypothetical protein